MTPVQINHRRADLLVQLLADQYQHDPFFTTVRANLIENQVPHGVQAGSAAHAQFLFFAAANDHGLKSDAMYRKAMQLYADHPAYFDPVTIMQLTAAQVHTRIVQPLGARYPNALVRSWMENAVSLQATYAGQAMNLFQSTDDAAELLRRLKRMRGYGPKISGMVVRACYSLKFNPRLTNLQAVLVPVDVHDARILFKTGVFTVPGATEADFIKYVVPAQRELLAACNRNHLDWTIVDKALWLTGSQQRVPELVAALQCQLDEVVMRP